MLQAAVTWLLYFLRAKWFPGKWKNALRICVDCHVKWKVHMQAHKKIHLCVPRTVFTSCNHCHLALSRRVH